MLRPAAVTALAAFAFSCGPGRLDANPPPLAKASNEPWVAEHRALVTAGCDCKTSECLEEHKTKIDALVADHGGLDESPADVHVAHGEFERCYKDGTRDPVRDLRLIVRRLCTCTTAECVEQATTDRGSYEAKYGAIENPSGELAQLEAEYTRCKGEKITDGKTLAEHYEKVAATVCDCAANNKCGTYLTDLPPMPDAPVVRRLDIAADRIKAASDRLCNCAQNAGLFGTYGGFEVARRCPKKEK